MIPGMKRKVAIESCKGKARPRTSCERARRCVRVLVACKSASLREAVSRFVGEQGGLEVVAGAGDGQEAVRLAADSGAELVLMDMHMSRMDGLEAARRMKGGKKAPVVILCALDNDRHSRAAAKAAGADAFVPKAPRMLTSLRAVLLRIFPWLRWERQSWRD
jgi:CheY-like chemotaxis protein